MKRKVLYLTYMISFTAIFACNTQNGSETIVDGPMETTTPVIDEAVVDSIEGEIDDLEKEIDNFLEEL